MKIKLIYLDIKGLAESIRLTLYISDIPFEDCRVTYSEIASLRHLLPYGQVPVLEVDGISFGQSTAILRWAGRKGGLYPDSLQLECDGVLSCIDDINKSICPLWYDCVLGRCPGTGEKLVQLTKEQGEAVKKHLEEDVLPGYLAMLERRIKGKKYFCGEEMTIADLRWYVLGMGFMDGTYAEGISKEVLEGFPGLVRLVERVGEQPKVVEWNTRN